MKAIKSLVTFLFRTPHCSFPCQIFVSDFQWKPSNHFRCFYFAHNKCSFPCQIFISDFPWKPSNHSWCFHFEHNKWSLKATDFLEKYLVDGAVGRRKLGANRVAGCLFIGWVTVQISSCNDILQVAVVGTKVQQSIPGLWCWEAMYQTEVRRLFKGEGQIIFVMFLRRLMNCLNLWSSLALQCVKAFLPNTITVCCWVSVNRQLDSVVYGITLGRKLPVYFAACM